MARELPEVRELLDPEKRQRKRAQSDMRKGDAALAIEERASKRPKIC
jgi:hypothetical protein